LREWRRFADWARSRGLEVMPTQPDTIIAYLGARGDELSASAQWLVIAAIEHAHALAGIPSPTSEPVFRSSWRAFRGPADRPVQRKQAIGEDLIGSMIEALPATLLGRRDAAIILLGYRSGLRRSELAGLQISDVRVEEDDLLIQSTAVGRTIRISDAKESVLGAARAVLAWIQESKVVDGPLFRAVNRHGQLSSNPIDPGSITRAIKRAIERCGNDPSNYACESLRSDSHAVGRKLVGPSA
jgi:integrase